MIRVYVRQLIEAGVSLDEVRARYVAIVEARLIQFPPAPPFDDLLTEEEFMQLGAGPEST